MIDRQKNLFGRFPVLGQLQGGTADVYICEHPTLDQVVAIKVPRRVHAQQQLTTVEIRLLLSMPPNLSVVPILFAEEWQGILYFGMECIAGRNNIGETLRAYLHASCPPLRWSGRQIVSVMRGLEHAYTSTRLLHLDIKPDNILVDITGRFWLSDFGLAGATNTRPAPSLRIGTPGFQSPEHLGDGTLSERSDVFSMGRTLAFTIAHSASDPSVDVAALKQIASRAASSDPLQRFSTIRDMRCQLESALGMVDTSSLAASMPELSFAQRLNRAVSKEHVGQSDEAARELRDLFATGLHSAVVAYNLGNILARKGSYDEATDWFERALADESCRIDALANLVFTVAAVGRYDAAIRYGQECLANAPDNVTCLLNLGFAYGSQGRDRAALEWFDRAVFRTPHNPDAHCARAVALSRLGRVDEARKAVDVAKGIAPASPRVRALIIELEGGNGIA